ncbi:MAG: flagellar basal-body rod protein FlgF [Burkholderiaceae bacterium]|nr:MAG: flagellar basal-body rod protein FlgF [Burkholderiaceae bacterium]
MDKMIYVAMSGAKAAVARQDTVAHNLANLNTTGFKGQLTAFRTAPMQGPGLPTRAYAVESTPMADFKPGSIQQTGRVLDVALQGNGFLAVQDARGGEAYTRNGHLEVNGEGVLTTANGLTVLGDGGPIAIPQDNEITIADDGTISAVPRSGSRATSVPVGRLKLVDLPAGDPTVSLVRGEDGLFRSNSGNPLGADENVRVASGALEGSNVNAVDMLVNMISVGRQFDMQMKLLQNAEANAREANQLLTNTG